MASGPARKSALVTGASSGIGRELSKLLAGDRYDLVLVGRDIASLEEVAGELKQRFGIAVKVLQKDLAEPGAAEDIQRQLRESGVDIDVLINNAGFNVYGPFWETDAQRELQMIQTNIVALTHLTKLLLPKMIKRHSGRILNVGSTGSFAPGPLNAVYCASKAYVLSFSEALAEELRGTGVTVTALCPGATKTKFAERAHMTDTNIFRGSLLSAAAVAETGYRAMMRGQTSVVVGLANQLTVFSLRFMPRDLVARIGKGMMTRSGSATVMRTRDAL